MREFGEWSSRGYLPHYNDDVVLQAVTYRLVDSLPMEVVLKIRELDKQSAPAAIRFFEHQLNKGCGSCILRDVVNASIVVDAWRFFDRRRYVLHAWVVMPNHVHVVVEPLADWALGTIVHSWKSFTAKRILARRDKLARDGNFGVDFTADAGVDHSANTVRVGSSANIPKVTARKVWQREYFDTFVRSEEHYRALVRYIHQNPVAAGLVAKAEDWPWSSAAGPIAPF
ncbi:MAG TPA: transposase [Opitutaceae bacterium]|nr:transposase [Opitutaceae bacterium]